MLEGIDPGGISAALDMLDQSLARLGTIPQLQTPAIELEKRRGHIDNAIERLETLKPTLGRSPDWKTDMGEVLLLANRDKKAQEWFDAAAEQLETLKPTTARRVLGARLEPVAGDVIDIATETRDRLPPASHQTGAIRPCPQIP